MSFCQFKTAFFETPSTGEEGKLSQTELSKDPLIEQRLI